MTVVLLLLAWVALSPVVALLIGAAQHRLRDDEPPAWVIPAIRCVSITHLL